jgi:hypothetical protein
MASTKLGVATAKPTKPAAKVAAKAAKVEVAATKGVPEGGARAERRAQKIKLLVKENPGREGSKRAAWYDLYKTSKTVGDYLDAGGDAGYLNADVKAERVALV